MELTLAQKYTRTTSHFVPTCTESTCREVLGPESTQAEDRITGIRSQNGDTESADAHDVATVEEGGTMRTGEDYDPKRSVALFLLKTREERNVTQTALNGMVQDIQGLWKDAMETMKVSFNIGWCVFVCVFYLYYIIFGCRIRCRNICMMGTWMKCLNAFMTHHPLMVLEHSTCSTSTLRKTFTSWRVLHISNSYIIMYTVLWCMLAYFQLSHACICVYILGECIQI